VEHKEASTPGAVFLRLVLDSFGVSSSYKRTFLKPFVLHMYYFSCDCRRGCRNDAEGCRRDAEGMQKGCRKNALHASIQQKLNKNSTEIQQKYNKNSTKVQQQGGLSQS
jgi:hypothetical protein